MIKRSENFSARCIMSIAAFITVFLLGVNAQAQAPSEVMSPVQGKFLKTTNGAGDAFRWTFNQSPSQTHCAGCGIGKANDTYAFDCNLNSPIYDFDNHRLVFPVATGTVVAWSGYGVGIGGNYGAVLIEHTNIYGQKWYSGYLHMSPILVNIGQSVDTNTVIGRVSSIGLPGVNHLHFAVYDGYNGYQGLLSKQNVSFIERDDHADGPAEHATSLDPLGWGTISTPRLYPHCFIEIPDDYDLFSITVQPNSEYKIQTTVIGNMDTVLFLYDQDLNYVSYNDDYQSGSLASELWFTTGGYSGKIYIFALHYDETKTGEYGFKLTKVN